MESWMVYGILTAVFLGVSSILLKVAGGPSNYNLPPHAVALFVLLGAAIVFVPYFLVDNKFQVSINYPQAAIVTAVISGILWALASVFLYKGFSEGADASKIVPLMNTSALVAVIIGVLLLHEMPNPSETWKMAVGACMIVLGASLLG
ncbi:MAG: GRP family sugar transporter [Candidatus Micrarchaeota archaeon]